MPDLAEILNNDAVRAAVWAILGALFWNFVALSRGRVRVLEYTVNHDRVGVSANDAAFGNVATTWQGNPVVNLYLSTVTLENNTASNLKDLAVKTWTGEQTFLLNESREIVGSIAPLRYTTDYAASIDVPPGANPTPQQNQTYWHRREYDLPVFNRNQRVIIRYITTAPERTDGPWIWMDIQHQGVSVQFRGNLPQVHGVPVKFALPIGLAACVTILLFVVLAGVPTWIAALVCLLVGLSVQALGAGLFRIGRFFYRVIFH